MTFTASVQITAGTLRGVAYWDHSRQTYAALLRMFDDRAGDHPDGPGAGYPPSWARFGLRTCELLTVDALVNHLEAAGLTVSDDSLLALQRLRQVIVARSGSPELVGLVGSSGRRYLFVLTPSGMLVAVNPRFDHPDHRLDWGDAGPATVETARLISELALVRRPAPDVESFALTLTYEVLADLEGDFSIDVNSLCDWFLTDAELATSLKGPDLAVLRVRAGLVGPPHPRVAVPAAMPLPARAA